MRQNPFLSSLLFEIWQRESGWRDGQLALLFPYTSFLSFIHHTYTPIPSAARTLFIIESPYFAVLDVQFELG